MEQLLDVTDRRGRALQNGGIVCGALLAVVGVWLLASATSPAVAGVLLVVGLALTVAGGRTQQRWEAEYRGHQIRFVNAPTTGEKLFIDDRLAARGGLGVRMELKATILDGRAAGDEVIALVDAGMLTLRLQLFARPSSA
ncbi:MAG: hypothetical protein GKS06_13895 [Acidobacteria bacterium]|nr:hypothetical protein [Acidobacteriota bacterium]